MRRRPGQGRPASRAMLVAGALAAAALAAAPAGAAGLYIPGTGGPGQGRAGAYFTAPRDISALWYNPAALASLGGLRLTYENTFVLASASFDRLDDPTIVDDDGGVFPAVRSSAGPFYIPMLGLTAATGRGVTFALAFYAPHAGTYTFPAEGPQRYGTIASNTGQTFLELALGAAVAPTFDVGITAGVSTIFVDEIFAIHADLVKSELRASDATVSLKAKNWVTPSLGAGLRWRPAAGLTLALSARAPVQVRARGRFSVELGEALEQLVDVVGDEVTMTFQMPLIVNAAIGWAARDGAFDLELAFVWENWSVLEEFTVDASGVAIESPVTNGPVGELAIDRGLHDGFGVRLGSDFRIVRGRLTGRLGVAYDSPGMHREKLTASSIDTHKLVAAAGLTAFLWKLELSLSYMHIWMPTLVVTDSTYTQLNALDEEAVTIVGNGTYRSSYDVLSLAVTLAFGGP